MQRNWSIVNNKSIGRKGRGERKSLKDQVVNAEEKRVKRSRISACCGVVVDDITRCVDVGSEAQPKRVAEGFLGFASLLSWW